MNRITRMLCRLGWHRWQIGQRVSIGRTDTPWWFRVDRCARCDAYRLREGRI